MPTEMASLPLMVHGRRVLGSVDKGYFKSLLKLFFFRDAIKRDFGAGEIAALS